MLNIYKSLLSACIASRLFLFLFSYIVFWCFIVCVYSKLAFVAFCLILYTFNSDKSFLDILAGQLSFSLFDRWWVALLISAMGQKPITCSYLYFCQNENTCCNILRLRLASPHPISAYLYYCAWADGHFFPSGITITGLLFPGFCFPYYKLQFSLYCAIPYTSK